MEREELQALGDFFEKWSAKGYPFLSEDKRAFPERCLSELVSAMRRGDEQAKENMAFLKTKFIKPELTDFDLKGHFLGLLNECGGLDKRQTALFREKMQTANICAMVPIERFCPETKLIKLCDKETAAKYQEQAEKILKRLLEAKGQPNEKMAEMLKDNPVIFCFEESKEQDAGMSGIFLQKKNRPLMTLLSGLMEQGKCDEDSLAATMAHELGHWLDHANRPQDYLGKEKLWQECFADVTGYMMAKNAGYDVQKRIEKCKEFAAVHRETMTARGVELPKKTIFEERAELLDNMFGEGAKHQVLQYALAAKMSR